MKKILALILSALSALTVFAFAGCTNNGEDSTTKTSQWDYFNEYVEFCKYYRGYQRNMADEAVYNSLIERQEQCWCYVKNRSDVSMKDMVSHSEFDYYLQLFISPVDNIKPIVMTQLSLQIFAESDAEMQFSLSITGDSKPRAYKTISAVANTSVELLFDHFAEYTWTANSASVITIQLENPGAIGDIKYGFSDLNLTLKQ